MPDGEPPFRATALEQGRAEFRRAHHGLKKKGSLNERCCSAAPQSTLGRDCVRVAAGNIADGTLAISRMSLRRIAGSNSLGSWMGMTNEAGPPVTHAL